MPQRPRENFSVGPIVKIFLLALRRLADLLNAVLRQLANGLHVRKDLSSIPRTHHIKLLTIGQPAVNQVKRAINGHSLGFVSGDCITVFEIRKFLKGKARFIARYLFEP